MFHSSWILIVTKASNWEETEWDISRLNVLDRKKMNKNDKTNISFDVLYS